MPPEARTRHPGSGAGPAPPVPLTILGGYLGAGKTTILNSLLRRADGRRLAVLVNDFGEVNIDAEILRTADDGVVELSGGCVCCDLSLGMGPALASLLGRSPRPEQILVEVSGVGEPASVAAWAATPGLRPDGIAVAVPLDRIRTLVGDRWVGDLAAAQLAQADVLLCTRGDLLTPPERAATTAWLRERSDAPAVDAAHGEVPGEVLFGIGAGSPAAPPHGHAAAVVRSSTWRSTGAVDPDEVRRGLAAVRGLLRAKGFLGAGRNGAVPLLVQGVGAQIELSPWTAAPATGPGRSVLSVITAAGTSPAEVAAALPGWTRTA